MSKKEKKMNNALTDDTIIEIPEDEIYTYHIEGLSPPHINKPYKHYTLKKAIFIIVIVVSIALSMYFSLSILRTDTFTFAEISDGNYQFTKFSNPGYIDELTINWVLDIEYPENGFITKKVKSYSEDGKFLSETVYENNGEYVVYHYNGKDQYIKIERFGANGKLSYSADYDEKGRISKEYIYNTDGSLESYNIREYYSEINCIVTRYDANGNELGKYDTGSFGSGG